MKQLLPLLFLLLLLGCSDPRASTKETTVSDTTQLASPIRYAQRFSVKAMDSYTLVSVFGNKNTQDTTAQYILYPRHQQAPSLGKGRFYIPVPAQRVACMSSLYAGMLQKLGIEQRIIAVDNGDYYTNPFIQEGVKNGSIRELSKGPEMNVEQTLTLRPELILAFGMGNPEKDMNPGIVRAGIPVAISVDHLEDSPLARAEWLKFFALFFQKEHAADSLFQHIETHYKHLQQMATKVSTRPTVLTEVKFGDTWYVPGGRSFMARLLSDAGADYFWKEDPSSGSLPLSFEAVMAKAGRCDYWLNVYNCNSKADLLKLDPRYAQFMAVKTGKVYNNNKQQNAAGYSAYWETGIICPDEILEDMVHIFHPELSPDTELKYYKQLP